jgi:hypothetical protein
MQPLALGSGYRIRTGNDQPCKQLCIVSRDPNHLVSVSEILFVSGLDAGAWTWS